MTENERIIDRYMAAFAAGDHERVLDCLTDDIEWEVPGAFTLTGKAAFDAEIENPAFVGRPVIATTRTIEGANVVVAEDRQARPYVWAATPSFCAISRVS